MDIVSLSCKAYGRIRAERGIVSYNPNSVIIGRGTRASYFYIAVQKWLC